jgi:hypothetical protein
LFVIVGYRQIQKKKKKKQCQNKSRCCR